MLQLAAFLQLFQPVSQSAIGSLSESPLVVRKRLSETAITLVTAWDKYLGSLEGLESVMIESIYLHNEGNLRRSWVAMRKAMVIAQLMGLHRPQRPGSLNCNKLDPQTKSDPQFMWFRIVFFDRLFSLMVRVSGVGHFLVLNVSGTEHFDGSHSICGSKFLSPSFTKMAKTNTSVTTAGTTPGLQ